MRTLASGIGWSKSISGMDLKVYEDNTAVVETDIPVELNNGYYEAVIKNPGYHPHYPKPFERHIYIVNGKNLMGCLDAHEVEGQSLIVFVLASYETLKSVKLFEEQKKFPGQKLKTVSLMLNIIVESVDHQSGQFIERAIPFELAKSGQGKHH